MSRATFLIIEKEQPEGLSSRKLLIEAAKHNVLTAYSAKEGLEIFNKHEVDAVVFHTAVNDIPCEILIRKIKKQNPKMPVIVISPTGLDECKPADKILGSYNPDDLLKELQALIAA